MKKIINVIALSIFTLAISNVAFAQNGKAYGKKFKADNAFNAAELNDKMGDQSKLANLVMVGEISQVCQAEGCWMKLKNENGEDIFVKFKDHSFVIPKDLAGHKAFVNGTAVKKSVSVEEQKHLAEDAGKSNDEISAINAPKEELRVEATGVIIE